MIDELIQQLDDVSPVRRKDAVIALGKSRDMAALRPLAKVYRTDPDPEVRELARKAGIYIRQQNEGATVPPKPTASPPPTNESYTERRMRELQEQKRAAAAAAEQPQIDPEEARRRPVRGREYAVPKEVRERARKYVDVALTENLNGDNAKAMKNLTEALSLDPNLINDGFFNSVATSVTELEGDAAIDVIIDKGRRKEFSTVAKGVAKQAKIEKHMTEVKKTSWADVGWEVVLYTLIVSIGPMLQTLVTMEAAQNFFNAVSAAAPEAVEELPPMVTQLQSSMSFLTSGTLVPVAFISGLIGVGGLLLQLTLVHFLATYLFKGHGTIRHLFTTLLADYNRKLPFIFLLSYISTVLFFITAGSPITLCGVLVFIGQSGRTLGGTAGKIGKAYDFGMLRGCLSLNVANFMVTAVVAVVVFALWTLVGAVAFQTFFQLNPTAIPPAQ